MLQIVDTYSEYISEASSPLGFSRATLADILAVIHLCVLPTEVDPNDSGNYDRDTGKDKIDDERNEVARC